MNDIYDTSNIIFCTFISHRYKEAIVCEAFLMIGDSVLQNNPPENEVEKFDRVEREWLETLGCDDDDETDYKEYLTKGESDDDDEG